jgi:phage terminase small subunit
MADASQSAPLEVVEAQPELFALADVAGYGALSQRERLFVEGLMAGKTRAEAARAAGVTGSEENVRTAGSRLAAKPRVAAVLAQAWRRSGANIEQTAAQAAEIASRAAEKLREATSPKERAQALREWDRASTLLASIHGKLQLTINGQMLHDHNHMLMTPELAERLVASRRALQESVMGGGGVPQPETEAVA